MAKVHLSEDEIKMYQEGNELDQKYLEYYKKTGGREFYFCIGMPFFPIDEKYGGLIGMYDECIKRGITWEELLGTDGEWNTDEIPA